MSVFGGLEDNAPDGNLDVASAWRSDDANDSGFSTNSTDTFTAPNEPSLVPELTASADDSTNSQSTTKQANKTVRMHPNSQNRQKRRRLQVHVTKVEPARTGLVVFFDVDAQLPRFQPHYRSVRRTHAEMKRFADHLSNANPECFVPALPDPQTSHRLTDDMCDQLTYNFQKWFDRVTRSPLLVRDDEFLYFVEATTGYVPSVKLRPPATGLTRKMVKQLAPPPDENEALREFRPTAKLLYTYAGEEFAQRLDSLCRSRRALAKSLQKLSTSLASTTTAPASTTSSVSSAQPNPTGNGVLGSNRMLNRLHSVERVLALAELKRAESMETTLGDTMAQVSREAFIVKETLTNRHLLMRDLQKSQTNTREKHQRATRLKGAGNISPAKVDEAITQLEQAAHLEKRITTTVHRVSDNLVAEKQLVLNRIENDVLHAVAACALQSIDIERASLAGWEDGRTDVRSADPQGGLSTLGRDPNEQIKGRKRFSQGSKGDEWSDRVVRARDTKKVENKEDVLDSVQAAQLLATD